MLDQIDLEQRLTKSEYHSRMEQLGIRLGVLHRRLHELEIPAVIVFEGWDAAGRGTLINDLILRLDPRGFKVFANGICHEEAQRRPFLWRYWNTTPPAGRLMIYDQSWYGAVLSDRIDGVTKAAAVPRLFEEIVSFERQLTDSGCIMIKFFLHIAKKEQKKRFEELENDPATSWRVGEVEWKRHRKYQDYAQIMEEVLNRTDTENCAWTPVAATDRRFAAVQICDTVATVLEQRIKQVENAVRSKPEIMTAPQATSQVSVLDKIDLSKARNPDDYEAEMDHWGRKLHELHYITYKKKIPLLVLFEGWDAAGKGGAIKRLVQNFDPRGYEVNPISAPNDTERSHHYLWRFWQSVPAAGRIGIFDRTWYGRVLVERVEGFCQESDWRRAYREINEFEEQLAGFGAIIVKFWLHIDKEEQLRRFKDRTDNPDKQWKITSEDWRNRDKWDAYKSAVDEMLFRTSSRRAPWTVVEANSKEYARCKVLRTVAEAMEQAL